jgi:hypothetical protein
MVLLKFPVCDVFGCRVVPSLDVPHPNARPGSLVVPAFKHFSLYLLQRDASKGRQAREECLSALHRGRTHYRAEDDVSALPSPPYASRKSSSSSSKSPRLSRRAAAPNISLARRRWCESSVVDDEEPDMLRVRNSLATRRPSPAAPPVESRLVPDIVDNEVEARLERFRLPTGRRTTLERDRDGVAARDELSSFGGGGRSAESSSAGPDGADPSDDIRGGTADAGSPVVLDDGGAPLDPDRDEPRAGVGRDVVGLATSLAPLGGTKGDSASRPSSRSGRDTAAAAAGAGVSNDWLNVEGSNPSSRAGSSRPPPVPITGPSESW